jgi:hypothetical protein
LIEKKKPKKLRGKKEIKRNHTHTNTHTYTHERNANEVKNHLLFEKKKEKNERKMNKNLFIYPRKKKHRKMLAVNFENKRTTQKKIEKNRKIKVMCLSDYFHD